MEKNEWLPGQLAEIDWLSWEQPELSAPAMRVLEGWRLLLGNWLVKDSQVLTVRPLKLVPQDAIVLPAKDHDGFAWAWSDPEDLKIYAFALRAKGFPTGAGWVDLIADAVARAQKDSKPSESSSALQTPEKGSSSPQGASEGRETPLTVERLIEVLEKVKSDLKVVDI